MMTGSSLLSREVLVTIVSLPPGLPSTAACRSPAVTLARASAAPVTLDTSTGCSSAPPAWVSASAIPAAPPAIPSFCAFCSSSPPNAAATKVPTTMANNSTAVLMTKALLTTRTRNSRVATWRMTVRGDNTVEPRLLVSVTVTWYHGP